jgi:uncharacterized protein YecT (DUF1311 family)
MKKLVPILFFACALTQLSAQSIMEMNDRNFTFSDTAEKAMGRVYNQILKAHTGDKEFLEAFTSAQKAWNVFRAANIKAVYPAVDPDHQYGRLHPACVCLLHGEMAQARTAELRKRWIIGVEEDDTCRGSCAGYPRVQPKPAVSLDKTKSTGSRQSR